MTRMPIIIDTDPGLDDAVAILFALACGRFDLRAACSVAGNIGLARTTRNLGALLAVMGSRAPYAAGAAGPLAGAPIDEAAIHGADGLGGVALPDPAHPAADDAVALTAQVLDDARAGSISVLALGPLTNLALVARARPVSFARIGRLIAMGGAIDAPGNFGPTDAPRRPEFNMAADPQAAAEVFAAAQARGVPVTLIPLDVTRQVRADAPALDELRARGGHAARVAADLIAAYVTGPGAPSRPLHDPMVMLAALEPALFDWVPLRLSVDAQGCLSRDAGGASVTVAMGIRAEAARAALWAGLGA